MSGPDARNETAPHVDFISRPVRIFFRLFAWLLVFAVAASTLLPVEFRPATTAPASVERFLAFVVIACAFGLGRPDRRVSCALLVIAIAGTLETLQYLVPGRHGHMNEFVVKAMGAVSGVMLTKLIERATAQFMTRSL